MDTAKLRAWWWQRQGLDGSLAGRTAAEVLVRAGWSRSVGGVGPYLTLFSRAGIGRVAADQAAANLDIHELPSARGCTYVVPAADFALALKVGQGFGGDMNTARKLGVTDKAVDRLCGKVVAALARETLDPEQIREAVGGAVRSLGEAGKKKGLNSTLPLALGRLQGEGEIRRVPANGRLDQQRYRYALWRPNPLAGFTLTVEQAHVELARRFFRWIGPATSSEFQAFSGLSTKAAKAAIDPLDLVPAGNDSEGLLLPAEVDAFHAVKPAAKAQYVLVSSLDSIGLLRRDVASLLDASDQKQQVLGSGGACALGGLSDFPSHVILDRGRLIGLWEFDVETMSVAWRAFVAKNKALETAVKRTEEYVRTELGDARSFSLDSPKSRAPKIAALRKAAAR
jgi:hypothetical protein